MSQSQPMGGGGRGGSKMDLLSLDNVDLQTMLESYGGSDERADPTCWDDPQGGPGVGLSGGLGGGQGGAQLDAPPDMMYY